MMQRDRERMVRYHLFRYAEHKKEIAEYEDDILYGSKAIDISGVHGTWISDSTARKGMKLAEMPEEMIINSRWIEAIDCGLRELLKMDKGNDRGYAYICKHMYGIPNKRIQQGTVRIAIECSLSRATVYTKLQTIMSVMIFHATSKGLLK